LEPVDLVVERHFSAKKIPFKKRKKLDSKVP
jgi:hypothetical protein